MLPAVLALCSSVVWGASDFVGGLLVRRYPLAAFVVVSQAAGLAALALIAAGDGRPLERDGVELGLAAGAFGAVSLVTFFRAVALGLMSVASPLLSCGAVLAFGLALAAGERPSSLAVLGVLLAVGGAVLVSVEEHASGGARRRALPFALAAPLAMGFYLFLLGRASDAGGSVSAVLGSRAVSFTLLVLLALALRPSFRFGRLDLVAVALVGTSATGSLLLFGYAADIGLVSIAAVLGSQYPVVTVLLAHLFAGERLRGPQVAGVPLALAGVALVTLG